MYYYIVAALPYVTLADGVEADVPGFMSFTGSMLPSEDFDILTRVDAGDAAAHPFAAAALGFQREFAAELARNRALNLGRDQNPYARSGSTAIIEKARQLAGMDDPLEAEMQAMQFSWSFLDDLETGHYFDLERLIVHLLKLKLLVRRNAMTEEQGTARYNETYRKITSPLSDAEIGV